MIFIWLLILLVFGASSGLSSTETLLENKLLSQIKKIYGEEEKILVRLYNVPKDLKSERSVKGIVITKLPDRRGDGQVVVDIEDNHGRKRSAYVSFRVLRTKKFYILKKDMKRGETLKASDLYERTAFLNDSGFYPSSLEDIEGKRLRRDVPANTPVTKEILEETYVIKRGEIVTVRMENERMRVSAWAISLEKGKIGDVVRLKNVRSGKEIVGLVSGEKEVTVIF